ncbi:Type II secretion system (T2SS), protein F [uncultured archaeon]|nr:Type II secretion system (T2SS), protein F [uncultured archaeon]
MKLIKEGKFDGLKRDLIKSNLQYLPKSYVSLMFFTTIIAAVISVFIFIFLIFFQLSVTIPFVSIAQESILTRIGKFFWVLALIPLATFFMMYLYPSVEKKSIEGRINQELPFAAINMAAIAGSMLDPTKIFEIIISTKEYPYLEKEFTKLINETNVLGYDLVTALRNRAFNSPSKKLAELFNGLATTINSGGDLVEFFNKRSQTLLFDYRLEREKYTRSAETFMDIYISVVIAAPMILMLLLMMMKISGLGVSLSTNAITLIMVLGVSIVNVAFITFLHLKQPAE